MDNKKLIIIGSSIIGVIVLVLIILWLISIFGGKKLSYEQVEEKIVASAEKYYKDNPTMLPTADGDYTLSYQTLVDNNYIKPLSDLLKDGANCSAKVTVNAQNSAYSYIVFLNCPGKYETKELKNIITGSVVTSGDGLYNDNGTYYYKGENVNNYIIIGMSGNEKKEKSVTGRIMSVENDGTIKVRLDTKTENTYVWDDRYNETKVSNDGYNIFEKSRLKDTLKLLETENKDSSDTLLLSSKIKSKLVSKNLCIGIRKETDTTKDGSTECSVLSKDTYLFSLMTPYEYMRASMDENCKILSDLSCSNYNYLSSSNQGSEWLLTATDQNNYKSYSFTGTSLILSKASTFKRLRFIVSLNKHTFYKSGTGTSTDPYIIK